MKYVATLALLALLLAAAPAGAKKPKSGFNFEDWLGTYCSQTACLRVHNVRQGPMGYYLMLNFTTSDGRDLGGETLAPLDPENKKTMSKANYSVLDFTLGKDGKRIDVTRSPGMEVQPEDKGWIEKVFGAYIKK